MIFIALQVQAFRNVFRGIIWGFYQYRNCESSQILQTRLLSAKLQNQRLTLDHVFASLAAGGPAEDVLLEAVSLERLHRGRGLRLGRGPGGHRRRGAD